ncbi:hypothetical protein LEP1GSC058_4032 [Leptospira fainei serovar Hurstbridge str. BUT 6]|uniref:Uncharacterized protein n=1 Tax=Leptospira fainei serovar Hurstbridge str. BUT 6 TaxID=1193011 RepID=S3W1A9_9LEPT|nr:hypothetical protein LEP1GSC058_4032 [Leptospira fainei serovar Hurstbridge str. BUT 6]
MIRVVRIIVRHRKIFVFRPNLGTDNVGIFVNTRVTSLSIKNPISAYLIIFLENHHVQSVLNAIFSCCNSAGPGSDDANTFIRLHEIFPFPFYESIH